MTIHKNFLHFALLLSLAMGLAAPQAVRAAEKTESDAKTDAKKAQQKKSDSKQDKADVDKIGEREVGKGMNFYSIEEEIALGKQLAAQVEQSSQIIQDPVIAEYINRLGQNLVRNSDAKVPFTIKMVDTEEVNAFALPGGYVYVFRGLVEKMATDDELAARGVEQLPAALREAGLVHRQDALLDQRAASIEQMDQIAEWLDTALHGNARVAIHCMAGLGRSGMVAASYLTRTGMRADAAIALVRDKRSPRAVETAVQEKFVQDYAAQRE